MGAEHSKKTIALNTLVAYKTYWVKKSAFKKKTHFVSILWPRLDEMKISSYAINVYVTKKVSFGKQVEVRTCPVAKQTKIVEI